MNAHQRKERKRARRTKRLSNNIKIEQFGYPRILTEHPDGSFTVEKGKKLRRTERVEIDPTERLSERQLDQGLATQRNQLLRSPDEQALRKTFKGIYPRQRNHAPA